MDALEKHLALIKKQEEEKREKSPQALEAKRLASTSIQLSRYRNERNLMLYPFCSTSKRKRLKAIEYKSSDGIRWLQVTANHTFGMAKIWDFDILRFALSKAGEIALQTGYFPKFVTFKAYECLKAIGRDPKAGKNYEWLAKALDRLVSTIYKGNIFKEDTKLTTGFNLISFEYLKDCNGNVEGITIDFNERLVESAQYKNGLLSIGKSVIKEESGIKKRLLELVKVSKGTNTEWVVKLSRLRDMCAHEGTLKEFKRLIKSYELPWTMMISKAVDRTDKVTFLDK